MSNLEDQHELPKDCSTLKPSLLSHRTSQQEDSNDEPHKNRKVFAQVLLKAQSTYSEADTVQKVQSWIADNVVCLYDGMTRRNFDYTHGDSFMVDNVISLHFRVEQSRIPHDIYQKIDLNTARVILTLDTPMIFIVHKLALSNARTGFPSIISDDSERLGVIYNLPNERWADTWDKLHYLPGVKETLVDFTSSAILFSKVGLRPNIISYNRTILLHGEAGNGKTSLCQSFAHFMACKWLQSDDSKPEYEKCILLEVNTRSILSKWFGESGKVMDKLFSELDHMLEKSPSTFVFVFLGLLPLASFPSNPLNVLDEVESLVTSRTYSTSSREPVDAIRAVNAVLTGLDSVKHHYNVFFLMTSNLPDSMDPAFLDRIDVKLYIGPPVKESIYHMLESSLMELIRVGIVDKFDECSETPALQSLSFHTGLRIGPGDENSLLKYLAKALVGLSGRFIQRLPMLMHCASRQKQKIQILQAVIGMFKAAHQELQSMDHDSLILERIRQTCAFLGNGEHNAHSHCPGTGHSMSKVPQVSSVPHTAFCDLSKAFGYAEQAKGHEFLFVGKVDMV